jgi:hypothetical protein
MGIVRLLSIASIAVYSLLPMSISAAPQITLNQLGCSPDGEQICIGCWPTPFYDECDHEIWVRKRCDLGVCVQDNSDPLEPKIRCLLLSEE